MLAMRPCEEDADMIDLYLSYVIEDLNVLGIARLSDGVYPYINQIVELSDMIHANEHGAFDRVNGVVA